MHRSPRVSFILSKLFCFTPLLLYLADSTLSDVLSHPQDAIGGHADHCAHHQTWRRRVLSCVIESRFPLSLITIPSILVALNSDCSSACVHTHIPLSLFVPMPHRIQGTHTRTLSIPLLLSLTSSLYSRLSLGMHCIQACMYISCCS